MHHQLCSIDSVVNTKGKKVETLHSSVGQLADGCGLVGEDEGKSQSQEKYICLHHPSLPHQQHTAQLPTNKAHFSWDWITIQTSPFSSCVNQSTRSRFSYFPLSFPCFQLSWSWSSWAGLIVVNPQLLSRLACTRIQSTSLNTGQWSVTSPDITPQQSNFYTSITAIICAVMI